MTDYGEPGTKDTVGIQLQKPGGALWFSSNWDGTSTLEKVLGGGNAAVR